METWPLSSGSAGVGLAGPMTRRTVSASYTECEETHRSLGACKWPYRDAYQPSEMCVLFVKVGVLKDIKQIAGCARTALTLCTEAWTPADIHHSLSTSAQSVRLWLTFLTTDSLHAQGTSTLENMFSRQCLTLEVHNSESRCCFFWKYNYTFGILEKSRDVSIKKLSKKLLITNLGPHFRSSPFHGYLVK